MPSHFWGLSERAPPPQRIALPSKNLHRCLPFFLAQVIQDSFDDPLVFATSDDSTKAAISLFASGIRLFTEHQARSIQYNPRKTKTDRYDKLSTVIHSPFRPLAT